MRLCADRITRAFKQIALLPAMGYGKEQTRDLKATINRMDCDLVLFAAPIELPKLITINKLKLRVRYEYEDHSQPTLEEFLSKCFGKLGK